MPAMGTAKCTLGASTTMAGFCGCCYGCFLSMLISTCDGPQSCIWGCKSYVCMCVCVCVVRVHSECHASTQCIVKDFSPQYTKPRVQQSFNRSWYTSIFVCISTPQDCTPTINKQQERTTAVKYTAAMTGEKHPCVRGAGSAVD